MEYRAFTGDSSLTMMYESIRAALGSDHALKAGDAGVECTLLIAPEMTHVWHYFPMLKEAHAAIASAGLWIKSKTAG